MKLMNSSSFPEVEKCVSDWTGCATTRAEVIDALHSLPSLEAQIELLSRLPDFLDEAKESVMHLPMKSEDWLPGAHIPRAGFAPSPEQLREYKRAQDAHLRRLRELQDYLKEL